MQDKPFTIVGINSDTSKEKARKAMEREKMTWRSFWDGGSTEGPISTKWSVQGWPTTYLLDAEGTVRFRNVRGEALDEAVDALLAEMAEGKR